MPFELLLLLLIKFFPFELVLEYSFKSIIMEGLKGH